MQIIRLTGPCYASTFSFLPKALIWESICSLVKPPMEMAKVGQCDAQMPHALQEATTVSAFFTLPSPLTIRMAW